MSNQYRLRSFLRDDPGEIERLNLMYYHPEVAKAKGYWSRRFARFTDVALSEKDALEGYDDQVLSRDSKEVSYAVADNRNKLVGWIWFYQDKSHPLPRRVASCYGVTLRSRTFQLSYEKILSTGWPDELLLHTKHVRHKDLYMERKGVIVEGMRLALQRLRRGYQRLYNRVPHVVLYAFVLPGNYASQAVLTKNLFVKWPRLYKCNRVLHQVWVREL